MSGRVLFLNGIYRRTSPFRHCGERSVPKGTYEAIQTHR